MAKTESVYQLVKSMNKNEKRLFTLQASLGGKDQNYLKVFNVLDKSKNYDAMALRKKLKQTGINISHEQNYLQKMILRSLRYYYSEQGIFAQLTESIRNTELLHKKKLNELNLEQLQKAKALAGKFEYYLLQMEILDWENRVNARMGNLKFLEDVSLEKSSGVRSGILKDYTDWQYVYSIAQKTTLIIRTKGTSLSGEDRNYLKRIIDISLNFLDKCKHSFRITEICLHNLYDSYSYLGEFKKALEYCEKSVAIYEKHPHFKMDLGFKYYAHSSNLVNRLINLKQYPAALERTNSLRNYLNDKKTISAVEINSDAGYLVCAHAMRIHALTGDFEKGMEVAKEYERMLKSNSLPFRESMKASFNIYPARIYFGSANFQKSLKCVNEMINYKEKLPDDFLQYAYLLRLIIQYEMGNTDLLLSLTQSAARLFREKWSENVCGIIVCEQMRQLLNAKNTHQKKNCFTELIKGIKSEEKAHPEKFEYIDFVRWAESKI